ncbi:branched-chain-amino-acid aminotransferase-like protein 2 [Acanthaster planci]|uniref:Branched-chain-amino-acid aminotransferase-like protein 2 n=1 Tax=Acanthaster planci TaxID=133434 RepID=A0A8B7ZR87_ACAPL|nr:branched-chain-amino-acid aminotransferase-like protein 2 [Acanthaster planci]
MADELNRVFLWGIPRSLTTVFIKCLSYVDGIQIATQLYADAFYFGPDAKRPVTTPHHPMGPKLNALLDGIYKSKVAASGVDPSLMSLESIRRILEAPYPGKKVFLCKDQAQYLDGRYDMLPKGFKYSFIIRHPNKVFPSYKKHVLGAQIADDMRTWPPIVLPPGRCYKELCDLVEYVRENIEPSPVILDADDLLQDPAGILSTYCSKMGIPYSSKLLSWKPGRDITSTWVGTKICMSVDEKDPAYRNVFESEGFIRPSPIPDLDSLPDDVQACVRYSIGYYEDLHRQRIVASR